MFVCHLGWFVYLPFWLFVVPCSRSFVLFVCSGACLPIPRSVGGSVDRWAGRFAICSISVSSSVRPFVCCVCPFNCLAACLFVCCCVCVCLRVVVVVCLDACLRVCVCLPVSCVCSVRPFARLFV